MAFWTDDETSKVNINTASEGSYWDTPKAATMDEMQFAGNPPAKGEFQRISGHPATTSLSAVFPEMRRNGWPATSNGFSRWAASGTANTTYLQEMQDLFSLTPRIDWGSSLSTVGNKTWGGSQAGTFPLSYTQTYAPATFTPKNDAVVIDTDRLYASADDAWFQASPTTGAAPTTRTANAAFANAQISPTDTSAMKSQQMTKRLFLFTANSRAPETTLFETPRISLWPVTWPYDKSTFYKSAANNSPTVRTYPAPSFLTPSQANLAANTSMTYQERLLAFCATITTRNPDGTTSPSPYYFQRENPDSPTYDWSNIDRNPTTGNGRNQDLVTYLRRELDQPFPGMSSGLTLKDSKKWGANNADWIALNTFDFSRSLINQYTYNQAASSDSDFLYTYTGVQIANGLLNRTLAAHGEPNAYSVVPLHVPFNGSTYTTEGAFPALKEACLVFYATARNVPVAPTDEIDPNTGKVKPETDSHNPQNWKNLITYGTGIPNGDKSQTTKMQAVMLLSFSGMNPGVWSARGQTYFNPVFWVKVSRAQGASSFLVNGDDINFPLAGGNAVQYSTNTYYASGNYLSSMPASLLSHTGSVKTFNNASSSYSNWSLVSRPITVSGNDTMFTFKGAPIQVEIYAPDPSGDLTKDPTTNPALLISSQQIDFSAWDSASRGKPLPIPLAPRWNVHQAAAAKVKIPTLDSSTAAAVNGWQTELVPFIEILNDQTGVGKPDPRFRPTTPVANYYTVATTSTEPVVYAYCGTSNADPSLHLASPDFANRVQGYRYSSITATNSTVLKPEGIDDGSVYLFQTGSQGHVRAQAYQLVTPYDTAISMVADPAVSPSSQTAGDPRLLGRGLGTSLNETGSTTFVAIDQAMASSTNTNPVATPLHTVSYQGMYARATDQAQYHTLPSALGMRFPTGYWAAYEFRDNPSVPAAKNFDIATRGGYTIAQGLLFSRDNNDATVGVDTNITNTINAAWDWTTLPGNFPDGGYIARPDQDYQVLSPGGYDNKMHVPYFNDNNGSASSNDSSNQPLNVFIPNRQVPSPVVLGTLPSDMKIGWQTLNFCPNPAKAMNTGVAHIGQGKADAVSATGPVYTALPDHLLLDLLWMPVAEPYPISDQLSTAGKINLNYAMMPFPYIQRKTGLDAALKSVWLAAMPSPSSSANAALFAMYYKSYGVLHNKGGLDKVIRTRFPVNVDMTLRAFDYKFGQGDIFRSASQICDMFLYPNDPAATNTLASSSLAADTAPRTDGITGWWATKSMTADNAREDPYSAIYSRITTKSNTFTVHWKVQVLRKSPKSPALTWTDGKDVVASELRGSTLIERYIDPNATDIPDYATDSVSTPTAPPLSQFYKWRTVSENYFHP